MLHITQTRLPRTVEDCCWENIDGLRVFVACLLELIVFRLRTIITTTLEEFVPLALYGICNALWVDVYRHSVALFHFPFVEEFGHSVFSLLFGLLASPKWAGNVAVLV